jgi:hypothetical protein
MLGHNSSATVRTVVIAIIQTGVGCAVGLILGGRLPRPARKVTAASLFSGGALLAIPGLLGLILRTWNRPGSDRGARRRLDSIRADSGLPDEADVY